MKAIRSVITGMFLIFACVAFSQVSVTVNLPAPPPWGPAGVPQVRFYYLPDVEAYYDIQSRVFIYYGGGRWVRNAYLPGPYRNYDLYGGYKVVMTGYHGSTPYVNFKEHKMKYGKGYHGGYQKTVGERPGNGNSGNKGHEQKQGNGDQGKDKNSGHGNDKGGSHDNNKNMKENHGKGDGNGKRK